MGGVVCQILFASFGMYTQVIARRRQGTPDSLYLSTPVTLEAFQPYRYSSARAANKIMSNTPKHILQTVQTSDNAVYFRDEMKHFDR